MPRLRSSFAILVCLLYISSVVFVLEIPLIPKAHAAPVVDGSCASGAAPFNCTISTATVGDIWIVTVDECCSAGATLSVSNTQSNTFTSQIITPASSANDKIGIFTATATATTSTLQCATSAGTLQSCNALAVNGISGTATATNSGSAGAGTSLSTASTTFGSNSFLIGSYDGNGVLSSGTGFTLLDTPQNRASGIEYATSGVASPTTFPATDTVSGAWNAAGAVFSPPNVTLPLSVCLQETGATSGTFTLSGGSPSPSTIASQNKGSCTTTNITVNPSTTLTVSTPTDGPTSRYRMNSTSTSSTTENVSTCASGTCGAVQVDSYYQFLVTNPNSLTIACTQTGATSATKTENEFCDYSGTLTVSATYTDTWASTPTYASWIYDIAQSGIGIQMLCDQACSNINYFNTNFRSPYLQFTTASSSRVRGQLPGAANLQLLAVFNNGVNNAAATTIGGTSVDETGASPHEWDFSSAAGAGGGGGGGGGGSGGSFTSTTTTTTSTVTMTTTTMSCSWVFQSAWPPLVYQCTSVIITTTSTNTTSTANANANGAYCILFITCNPIQPIGNLSGAIATVYPAFIGNPALNALGEFIAIGVTGFILFIFILASRRKKKRRMGPEETKTPRLGPSTTPRSRPFLWRRKKPDYNLP